MGARAGAAALAAPLDPETPVPGVTRAPGPPEPASLAVPATPGGRSMAGDRFAATGGRGDAGPEAGAVERPFAREERAATGDALPAPGETTFDAHPNAKAVRRKVSAAARNYRLGGCRALKKWASFRECNILGRPFRPEEVPHFAETARRTGRY